MGKFNRGDRSGGNKRFNSDRGDRRGGRSERPSMHQAVCAECGRECEVPFRPTGDKPVYCSSCFGNKEGSGGGRFEGRSSGRSSFGEKQMFKAVCDKCGKECEVPFKPSSDKPVYCSDCFGKRERGGSGGNAGSSDQYKKQFEMLNNKLDNILNILSSGSSSKKTNEEKKTVAKTAEKKVEEKATMKKVEPKKADKKIIVKAKKVAPKKVVKKAVAKKKK